MLLSACIATPDTGMAGDAIGVTAADSAISDYTKALFLANLRCEYSRGSTVHDVLL